MGYIGIIQGFYTGMLGFYRDHIGYRRVPACTRMGHQTLKAPESTLLGYKP